ncbi:hypothetical protein [Rhodococcus pyridinivorans]|uniref:hypothetical protein n=1 Tax=Rhodococcus pyridinivorans TaxID=103816 RepID=UPI0011C40FF2|nr:hypothetical protein [Rhodococcus pyridinivorans]
MSFPWRSDNVEQMHLFTRHCQRWHGVIGSDEHHVDVTGAVHRHIRWEVNGAIRGVTTSWLPRTRLRDDVGRELRVRADQATIHFRDVEQRARPEHNLTPEPGSRAAQRHEEMLCHPMRYALRRAAGALATVIVPIIAIGLLTRLAEVLRGFGFSVPGMPTLPFSDFDLTDLGAPQWLQSTLDSSDFIAPIVIAIFLAWFEHRRRGKRKSREAGEGEGP